MNYVSTNLSVDELTARKLISVRAMNICKRSQLFTFDAIHAYFQLHGSFKKLPLMGNKTDEMLVKLCCEAAKQLPDFIQAEPVVANENHPHLHQPYAVINAYQRISEASRGAAEQVYGNFVCTLSRRTIRALFILYKTKTLAGLINGLQIKPSAFDLLAKALQQKGINLNGFLDELTRSFMGPVLTETANECKQQKVGKQLALLTRKADDRMRAFLKDHIHELETGCFPVSDFIIMLLRCDSSLKPTYKNAVLTSDLFLRQGLPPSGDLEQRLSIGRTKLKRLYQDNGQHKQVYNQVAQAIKILLAHGLVPPAGFSFPDAPYHLFTAGLPGIETPFTSRLFFPIIACFNGDYRMFYRAAGNEFCALFVNKSIESWFNTAALFAALEKKVIPKTKPDDTSFLLQLLLPFCRRTPSNKEQQYLFAFTKPLLQQLHDQQRQSGEIRQPRRSAVASRWLFISRFIKDKNRHCHIDEIAAFLRENGEAISHKKLLKYLEKWSVAFKPLYGDLFQLREWETNRRWQQETVVQLAIHFLSAYPEPQHIYSLSRYICKYKNVALSEVADIVLAYSNVYFSVQKKGYFGLCGKPYPTTISRFKKVPAYWFDNDPFSYYSELEKGIHVNEMVKFFTKKYKLTKDAAQQMIAVRIKLGEWKYAGEGWLQPANETSGGNSNLPMQRAV